MVGETLTAGSSAQFRQRLDDFEIILQTFLTKLSYCVVWLFFFPFSF